MIILTITSSGRELGESVLFQLVLKAYPTHHSWIINVHVSLGHLECHWNFFNRQLIKTRQLLQFLSRQPSAPTQLISSLQMELFNIDDIHNSCKHTIISAINLINTNLSFDGKSQWNTCHKRSLLPFLGDGRRWLTGTTSTKDVNSIKTRVNQHIVTQSSQQETLVHIESIINVICYAVQVKRHSINILMNKVDETSHDISNLYNPTISY